MNSIVGLFGFNGCGKSTLIKIGAGFLTQKNGNIFIEGKVIENNYSTNRYNYLGYLPQDSFLPKDMTVWEFLKISTSLNKNLVEDPIINKIINQKIVSLSGGELRYLEILFLFSLDRQYYLLDEPFTGVEPIYIEKIVYLIQKEKQKGKGILITDHYHHYVTDIIDKCYLMKDGYLEELDKTKDFRKELLDNGYLAKL